LNIFNEDNSPTEWWRNFFWAVEEFDQDSITFRFNDFLAEYGAVLNDIENIVTFDSEEHRTLFLLQFS
jgi:hypothetical protein